MPDVKSIMLYPKPASTRKAEAKERRAERRWHRRWCVDYTLSYDGKTVGWMKFYRTELGARISAYWNVKVASDGGTAELVDRKRP